MSPLEAAQAEVDRLKLEADTIPFTKSVDRRIERLSHEISYYRGLLGFESIDPTNDDLYAPSHLKTITDLQSRLDALEGETRGDYGLPANNAIDALVKRLDALEAAASKTISIEIPRVVESWGDDLKYAGPWCSAHGVVQYAPKHNITAAVTGDYHATEDDAAKAVEAAKKPKTVSFNPMDEDATNGNALRHLLDCSARTIELAFGFGDDFDVKASPQRMAALKTVRDRLKEMNAKLKLAAKSLNVSIDVQELEAVKAIVATLKTQIATRDRLLDDQAATIGKLERERDEAKAMLHVVQTRVVGLDLTNIDQMRAKTWVLAYDGNKRVKCSDTPNDHLFDCWVKAIEALRGAK